MVFNPEAPPPPPPPPPSMEVFDYQKVEVFILRAISRIGSFSFQVVSLKNFTLRSMQKQDLKDSSFDI